MLEEEFIDKKVENYNGHRARQRVEKRTIRTSFQKEKKWKGKEKIRGKEDEVNHKKSKK